MRKDAFSVIGIEGSTNDGDGFIAGLWQRANENFAAVEPLAKRDESGVFAGFWGLMSDASRAFRPWEDGFTKGLYLAGVEVWDDATPPDGWAKWTAPASEYLRVRIDGDPGQGFAEAIHYMQARGMELVGAVYDYNAPAENGQLYMVFPIRRL